MEADQIRNYIQQVVTHFPADWLNLTTHRLDIYNEKQAKVQFLEQFEILAQKNNAEPAALSQLATAYDYIRLGHPLSCVLEWTIAKLNGLPAENVISFASRMAPVLAVLRQNLLDQQRTQIFYKGELPTAFDAKTLQEIYGYSFDLIQVESAADVNRAEAKTIFLTQEETMGQPELHASIDFAVNIHPHYGSMVAVNGAQNESYISAIQHFRRRETIAMTPADCLAALKVLLGETVEQSGTNTAANKQQVAEAIQGITSTNSAVLVGSSGLSVQYAIMMGLVHEALENCEGKAIKFVVPPNCYGGTNDQARRVAACSDRVEVVDLPVDGDNDMVQSVDRVLAQIAQEDAVPYIIVEIPTNPRVEVPNLEELKEALAKPRTTANGEAAVAPVFILDQTFCPNVRFCAEDEMLANIQVISYASGSKFPSGGKCTAGYCVANQKAAALMNHIGLHMSICDNEATPQQYEILANQLPSMLQRIEDAYHNTREFVNFIHEALPDAKINFVSEELAQQGFTPSVFSLDLPTKGETEEARETYKRALNLKLINLMIQEIPNESKYCVSYGQLRGCYWTIPATSTQGTTKEGDKDYIARVALSANMDLEKHKQVFQDFVEGI